VIAVSWRATNSSDGRTFNLCLGGGKADQDELPLNPAFARWFPQVWIYHYWRALEYISFSEIRELHVLIKVHDGKAPAYAKSATPQSLAGGFVHDCGGEKLWSRGRGSLYNWLRV